MALYARQPWRVFRQVFGDVFVLVWAVQWWFVGAFVENSVRAVAGPARATSAATRRLSTDLTAAGDEAARIPVIGGDLRRPFDSAAESLVGLRSSAEEQVASIERLAVILGWLVFAVPVAVLLLVWLPSRIAFVVRARTAQRFFDTNQAGVRAGLDLFALRAMSTQPISLLADISSDPVAAWRAGDTAVIRRLAEAEMRRCGVSLRDISNQTAPPVPAAGSASHTPRAPDDSGRTG
jgi:hypothetical protein